MARRRQKPGRSSTRAASARNPRASGRGGRRQTTDQGKTAAEEQERLRRTYYPVFDALALLLIKPARFLDAVALYLREEARYRSALLFRSLANFFVAAVFLGAAAAFGLYAGFRLTELVIGDRALAAAIWALLAALTALVFVYRAARLAARLFEPGDRRDIEPYPGAPD